MERILLLGIGKTGHEVADRIAGKGLECIDAYKILKTADLKILKDDLLEKYGLVILIADLGDTENNTLALDAVCQAEEGGKTTYAFLRFPFYLKDKERYCRPWMRLPKSDVMWIPV